MQPTYYANKLNNNVDRVGTRHRPDHRLEVVDMERLSFAMNGSRIERATQKRALKVV